MPEPVLPLELLRSGLDSYAGCLQPSGELHDPVFDVPTQYATPYHALGQAALAAADADAGGGALERATRGLTAALDHLADPTLAPTASAFDRDTGETTGRNHRDFFWPPVVKVWRLLRRLDPVAAQRLAPVVAAVDVPGAFHSRPPSNWAAVWLSGEWTRIRLGLSPHTVADVDRWLEPFLSTHLLLEQGLYLEPGHSNSYDLFTRYHLADLLAEGYQGRWRAELERLLETGLARSLAVQLSDGSLASAHRSTGQSWTLGAQCAYFTLAARMLGDRDPAGAAAAREAARRALESMRRWQRADGPFSPVENLLPPSWRVGYEAYTADGHYANLALGLLAAAVLAGFAEPASGADGERAPSVWIEGDPTWRTLVHHGRYSAHVNGHPDPAYDGAGIVDLTVGPGRLLQFASPATHLQTGARFTLGLAHRPGDGAGLRVIAQQTAMLLADAEREGPAAVRLEGRAKGSPYRYRLRVGAGDDGVRVVEATPGLRDRKSLLVPYLRDAGAGPRTRVRSTPDRVELAHGDERVTVELRAPVERVLDLPHGYESRRGLCGLLRIDFTGARESIAYRVGVGA